MPSLIPEVVWEPPPDARTRYRLGAYMDWLERYERLSFETYDELWEWSVNDLRAFWGSMARYFSLFKESTAVLASEVMPGAIWFPGAYVNFAEIALRDGDLNEIAIVAVSQSRETTTLTRGELREQVARARRGLLDIGVRRGDCVAGYLVNTPEAVVAFLATVSIGAIWAVCPPEFGVESVLDRLAQIAPKVLIAVGGYTYGAREIDRSRDIEEICARLPSLTHTVGVAGTYGTIPDHSLGWDELLAQTGRLEFDQVEFGHPLWVLFSSGTTGLPKAIVHSHGGIAIESCKAIGLHHDIGAGDRFMFFSTTGWMMWNVGIATLAVGGSFVTVDGDPNYPDILNQWRIAAETGVSHFGSSAGYFTLCRDSGRHPTREFELTDVRAVLSAGSPLPDETFRWLARELGPDVWIHSGSGGTDVCTGLVGGIPLLPTCVGEMAGRWLGVDAHAYDERGQPVIDLPGELVITSPMPSMPISFWNDVDGSALRAAYFDKYPDVWRHGDWIVFTDRKTCAILGRSDATLNRGGVRLGTSEFYAVVEAFPEIVDSLVVHLDSAGLDTLLLFVQLAPGINLDVRLREEILHELRTKLSPRHSPDRITAVPLIPRTLTGKKLEVPVKQILQGIDPTSVIAIGTMPDATALDAFIVMASGAREPAP